MAKLGRESKPLPAQLSDVEIIAGTDTSDHVISAADLRLGAETHAPVRVNGKNTVINAGGVDVDPQIYSSDAAALTALGAGFLYLDSQGNVRKSGDGDAPPVDDLRYFGQTNWATNGGTQSRNLVPPMIDRLSGADARYTVTGTNFDSFNASALFDKSVESITIGADNLSPIVEVDFNPSVGWTDNTNTGFTYSTGMLVLHYYHAFTAGHIKVQFYKPVSGVDQWVTAFDADTGGSTQIIQLPNHNYLKKMRLTYSQPENGLDIWPAGIEYAPWRPSLSYKKDATSQITRFATSSNQQIQVRLPFYADDAAAGTGGLTRYEWYRRTDGTLAQKL